MKTLYLVRHAKSSWNDPDIDDFDRPLNKRGKINAPEMAQRMVERGELPNLIISSPAKRARSTAKMMAKKLGLPEAGDLAGRRIIPMLRFNIFENYHEN